MALDSARQPDFSTNGRPLVFGYAQQNSHTGTNAVARQIDVDNWSVAVYSHDRGRANLQSSNPKSEIKNHLSSFRIAPISTSSTSGDTLVAV
jgi:hypothetical protein